MDWFPHDIGVRYVYWTFSWKLLITDKMYSIDPIFTKQIVSSAYLLQNVAVFSNFM